MNQENRTVLTGTMSTGRISPGDAPKKPRRKKRAPKKSEVSESKFGTVSSAEPSHDENRPQQLKQPEQLTNRKRRGGLTTPDSDIIEDVTWATTASRNVSVNDPVTERTAWISPNEYGAKKRIGDIDTEYSDAVKKHRYKAAKKSAYTNAQNQYVNGYRAGIVLGITLGLVIGLGVLWLYRLYS